MEILELHLKHFGMFSDYRLNLHAGINIISGGNETGKSTLHAFVRAMLYGLPRNRSRNLDEYRLRQPWENSAYFAGSMRILYDGKIYRIDRNFYRKEESVSVVCETDGTQITDALSALGIFTAGLSESDFDNTVFIRQAQPQTSQQLWEHIRDFLVNLEENGTPGTDVSAAQELLKKKRKQTESEKNERLSEIEDAIRNNRQEVEYLNADLQRLLDSKQRDEKAGSVTATFERVETAAAAEQAETPGTTLQNIGVNENTESGSAQAAEAPGTEAAAQDRPDASTDETDFEEEDEPGGLLLPVLVLLSFVAAGLAFACAFITTDHRMRYVLGAGGGLFFVIAAALLWRITHPVNRTQKALKRAKYEAFLNRHLGFREDPDDPLAEQERLRRDRQLQRSVDKAMRLDREEEKRKEKARRALLEKTLREQEEEERQKRALEVQQLVSRNTEKAQEHGDDADAGLKTQKDRGEDVLNREIRQRRERLADLQRQLEDLYAQKAALASFDEDLQAIDLASARIRELSGRIYHESGDQFLETVSTLLAGLTEGRYTSVSLDERMQVKINTPQRLLELGQVSCGTMNQIYFALRLAAAQLLSGGADLPVILDEPFVMYDDERTESALRYLAGSGQQVLLFSCQKRELEILARIRSH